MWIVITIRHEGMEPFEARPTKIGAYCDKNETLPVSMQAEQPQGSRLLTGLEKKHQQSSQQMMDAISFGGYTKEVTPNV